MKINLAGSIQLAERLSQLSKIISVVSKTRSKYLLIKILPESSLNSKEDIDKLLSKVHQEDWALRNKNIFIKIAIYSPTLDNFNLHKKILQAKDLTNIQFFDDLKAAITWLDVQSSLEDITAYFQPIIRLNDSKVIGYEALARKVLKNKIIPIPQWLPQLFNERQGSYRLAEKMLLLAEKKSKQLSEKQYISVNFEVDEINSNKIEQLLAPFKKTKFLEKLVIEVCERGDVNINHIELIENIKKLNTRIALDDIGSGNDRLLQLLDFSPEILKLDKKVTDRMLEIKVASFISFFSSWCESNKISLLAEGIETREIAIACKRAGIKFGQGYLFGKPQAELLTINTKTVTETA
ncbi:EAL domain-containing protein [Colwellia piezophila]|uniref:EAL domain-containing protein n=1 Tax=Colwellia piezophila TaxID=211668 RepID=UPI00146BB07E|nr:EAL domain-containing protein [Colwellia piezophila]